MQYYILLPGDTEQDAMLETNLLGESSFKTFYAGRGLTALMKMIDSRPDMLDHINIRTDKSEYLTVEEFLTRLQPLKIIKS
jgi:hypothetical protein